MFFDLVLDLAFLFLGIFYYGYFFTNSWKALLSLEGQIDASNISRIMTHCGHDYMLWILLFLALM